MRLFYLIFLLLIFPVAKLPANTPDYRIPSGDYPNQKAPDQLRGSEFRAIWIATINNIDWPSKPNLPVEEQKAEFVRLLETFQKFNLNVVILQVRAASDAFYPSRTEPWSYFLTGKQGRPPKPYYDPLAWAIEQCHQRGMKLYAWFNPFRVRNLGYYPLDPGSFAARHPQFVKEYDKKLLLDPGYPEVRSHVVGVLTEVARNYNVDAILLDDYFYPYPAENKKFGDEKSFSRYGHAFYPKKLKEWRRENINRFISDLHDSLQVIHSSIKLGISPFGIWRNKSVDPAGSAGLRGLSSYDDLYADVRKWLMEGWIDFVVPQLYWEKGNRFGDFASLIQWWSENSYGKSLYIGQALYKAASGKNSWLRPDELNEQINFLRTNEKVGGFAFYSASNLARLSPSQIKSLRENQLQSAVSPDGKQPKSVTVPPVPTSPKADSALMAERLQREKNDLLASLQYQPVSIREIWKNTAGRVQLNKKGKGERELCWKADNDTTARWVALIAFQKTGERKYRQQVYELSESGTFLITEKKWKELKDQELLLFSRDIQSKKELFSDFFHLKKRKVKKADNPFRHRK